jgi:protoporphyrinogen/coproporphyrinogen III oxidase
VTDTGPTFAVVGGGITGLVAARELTRGRPRPRVVLFEAADHLGGKIRTEAIDGAVIEAGPDWFLTRRPEAVRLCEELGLGLVAPALAGPSVWTRGRIRPIPAGFVRGVPTSFRGLVRSGVVSRRGAVRALADLVLPGPLEGPDVSIGALVRKRMGSEVLDRLVDPVLAASRAGRTDELSLAAAAADIDEVARSRRSLMRGLRGAEPHEDDPGTPPFVGVAGGMQRLVDALVSELSDADIRLRSHVEGLSRADGEVTVRTADGADIRASGVVLAVPAHSAASLVAGVSPDAARELRAIRYASAAVIVLWYPPDGPHPAVAGSGFLVPSIEGKTLTACAWYSDKWPQARPQDGGLVLRAFVGRATDDRAVRFDDDELVARVANEIADATSLRARPRASRVWRWDKSLPQYAVGHLERIDRIERALERYPQIALAGAGYRGSGIPDCIKQGRDAAARIAASVASVKAR